jgi:hypothetical protein
MVLGFGEGSIEIVLDEGQLFEAGGIITGRIKLDLKERKKAKGLRIEFYGEIKKRRGKSRVTERVYVTSSLLGGEQEYPAGLSNYEFKIQLPQVSPRKRAEDFFGKIMDFIAPDPLWKAKWYLDASLELPMAFDVNQKIVVDFKV